MPAHWPMLGGFPAHLRDGIPVGEAEHVVEVLLGVLWITAGVRSTQHRHRAAFPKEVAQGVGQLGRLAECPDEDQVEIGGKLLQQILDPGVADEVYVMSFLLTPHCDDLRHDACEIRVHHPAIQRRVGTLRYKIENADAKSAH
jgi:hypothetical protein